MAISTAIVYLHRFYAVRSLKFTDHHIAAMACLFLGGKVEDSPKSVSLIIKISLELGMGSEREAIQFCKASLQFAKERVFTAERSILYALGFSFSFTHPTALVIKWFKPHNNPLAGLKSIIGEAIFQKLTNASFSLASQSLKTPLCLQLAPHYITVGCIWMASKLLKIDDVVEDAIGKWWWEDPFNTEVDWLKMVYDQMMAVMGVCDWLRAGEYEKAMSKMLPEIEIEPVNNVAVKEEEEEEVKEEEKENDGSVGTIERKRKREEKVEVEEEEEEEEEERDVKVKKEEDEDERQHGSGRKKSLLKPPPPPPPRRESNVDIKKEEEEGEEGELESGEVGGSSSSSGELNDLFEDYDNGK
jgi:cyclin T